MMKRKSGKIITISSVAGTRGIPQQAIYCASKHGVKGFSDALAQELVPHGILVHTLCPGGTNTPLWDKSKNSYPGDTEKLMKPEDIAELIIFLLHQPAGTLYKRIIFFPTNEWH